MPTHTKTVDLSISSTLTCQKKATKSLITAPPASSAVIRRISKPLTQSLSASVSLKPKYFLKRAIAMVSTGSVGRLIKFTQTVSAGNVSALLKTMRLIKTITMTETVSLVRLRALVISASASTLKTLTKKASYFRRCDVLMSENLTINRLFVKPVALVSALVSASLIKNRKYTQALTKAIAPTVSLKRAFKLVKTLTPGYTFSLLKSGSIKEIVLTKAAATSATLSKTIQRLMSLSASSTGLPVILKRIVKPLSATGSSIASVATLRHLRRAYAISLVSTLSLVKFFAKTLSKKVGAAPSLFRVFAGSILSGVKAILTFKPFKAKLTKESKKSRE